MWATLYLVALFVTRSLPVVFPLLTSSSLILTTYCDLVSVFARRACPIVWTSLKPALLLVDQIVQEAELPLEVGWDLKNDDEWQMVSWV